ncbi:MAG: MFS transporter [Chloroflexota bacterium]
MSPRLPARSAFAHRSFRLYWSAQLISMMGTFMQQVALGYLVYDITGSKWLLGIIAALQMGPSLILSLPAGVLADRVPRRNLILVTQSTALVLAFSLATLTAFHQLEVWEILLISTISGIAIAAESPARQALVVELVGREDVPNAIAWNSLITNGARVVGPAIGGVAIRYVGVAAVFYYNSFSFLAMIVALLLMSLPAIELIPRRHPAREIVDGLRYVKASPAILMVLGLLGVIATFTMNFTVLMPILAADHLHVGAEGLGWMWTAFGLGAVIGSMTVVTWSRAAVGGPLLLGTAILVGFAEVWLGISRGLLFSLAALAVTGWANGAFFAGANAAIQHRVADVVRGRVMGLYSMVWAGTGPIGGLFTAGLASAGGAPLPLFVGGGIAVAVGLAIGPMFLRRMSGEQTPIEQREKTAV